MAAESIGLAASVTGIVSLGLKVVGGIIKYVDAVEHRQEELESVRRQSKALNAILIEVDSVLRSDGQPGAIPDAVAQSIQLFETELSRLQALHTDLADSDPQNWTARLENKKKRVTYALKRSRIQELGLRLQKAGDALQLTIHVFGLQVSRQHRDALAAVELSSQDISFGVSVVRSEVAAIGTPIFKINDQLCRVQSSVDSNTQLLISHQESKNDVLRNVQEMNDSVLHQLAHFRSRHEREANMRHQEVMKMLQNLQTMHRESSLHGAVVRGLAGKPALLKELSDEVQPTGQIHDQFAEPIPFVRPSPKIVGPSIRHFSSRPIVGRVCTCPRLQRVMKSKWIQLGYASFSSERETITHWPGCPMAKMNSKKQMKMGFRYSGLFRILKTAVKVSFAMTSGAGGFSISPNFTCSPTVDDEVDPAFRIIYLLGRGLEKFAREKHQPFEPFMVACITRLIRLLDDGKVSAAAVNSRNMSLMHYAIWAVDYAQGAYHGENGRGIICGLFVELVQMLVAHGVAAFAFDLEGMSPLVQLKAAPSHREISNAVIDVLVQANSESQPLVLDTSCLEKADYADSNYSIPTIDAQLRYRLCSGFAEVCECGPLSMAVIQDDADAVEHMLKRTPDSIAEIDIFGWTPFHLAAANPPILEILLKYSDCNILGRRDVSGFTALETAMIRSSDNCDNGRGTNMCQDKNCSCCLCIDLFIGAECEVRLHKLENTDRAPKLGRFLPQASELARRKYVYYMNQRRIRGMRSPTSSPHASTQSINREKNTGFEVGQAGRIAIGSPQQHKFSSMSNAADDMSWIFLEFEDPHLGALFYHHGFQPHPSCLLYLRADFPLLETIDYSYLHWLVSHAVDPSFRSSRGPAVTKDSPKIGLFGAHFAFYHIPLNLEFACHNDPDAESWDSYTALTAKIWREGLTDGCQCCCTIHGCTPFTWMMKGSFLTPYWRAGNVQIDDWDIESLVSHYSRCGLELTSLTYKAAIRYATFGALGLIHTCCDAQRVVKSEDEWVDRDDVSIVNEEQASLLKLLEDLVEEFEEKAVEFMKTDSSGRNMFPHFWTLCWKVRIEKELEKLEGKELTDAERQGAEEMGVRWTVSKQEVEKGKPYRKNDPRHWFYELDKICPEYAEPWPEGLCRVSELS